MACILPGAFPGAEGRVVWKPCRGNKEQFFHWDSMEMSPDPAVLGRNMAVTITGKTGKLYEEAFDENAEA